LLLNRFVLASSSPPNQRRARDFGARSVIDSVRQVFAWGAAALLFSLSSTKREERAGERRLVFISSPLSSSLPARSSRGEREKCLLRFSSRTQLVCDGLRPATARADRTFLSLPHHLAVPARCDSQSRAPNRTRRGRSLNLRIAVARLPWFTARTPFMDPLLAKIVFVFGIVVANFVIRTPYIKAHKRLPIRSNRNTRLDTSLFIAVGVFGFFLPLLYVFTPLFSFADYAIPRWVG